MVGWGKLQRLVTSCAHLRLMLLDETTWQRAVTSESTSGGEFQLQSFGGEGAFEAANLARKVVLEDTHRCISMGLHTRLKIFN